MGISYVGKRNGYFVHWEPIYIGTHSDPHYDERLSWEGKSDKMTQVNSFLYFIRIKIKIFWLYFISGIRSLCFRL